MKVRKYFKINISFLSYGFFNNCTFCPFLYRFFFDFNIFKIAINKTIFKIISIVRTILSRVLCFVQKHPRVPGAKGDTPGAKGWSIRCSILSTMERVPLDKLVIGVLWEGERPQSYLKDVMHPPPFTSWPSWRRADRTRNVFTTAV